MLTKLLAFLWRDWQQARSYKLAFALQAAGLVLPLAGLYFVSQVFDSVQVSRISQYGGNYVAFALVGTIVITYSATALSAFSSSIRGAQYTGTLEVLLQTRTSLPTILVGWALYPFLRATVFMLAYLAGGFLILGLQLDNADLASAFLTLALTVAIMGSLGIFSASFTLVFKQGDPFTAAIVMAGGLLSGTLYPTSVFPGWLRFGAELLPQTRAIEAMRLSILSGYSPGQLAPQLLVLALMAAVLMPLSVLAFRSAMHRARKDGSLAHY